MVYSTLKASLAFLLAASPAASYDLARRRASTNATYRDPNASVDDRVADLLSRMTIEEKTAQLVQGDFSSWINTTSNAFNASGLAWNMAHRAGQFYVGYAIPQPWIAEGVRKAQDYLVHNTTLGIPAFVQTEGIHGLLIGNATIFNSPIGQASSWNTDLIEQMARIIADESKAIGVNQIFAPLADLARELRFGRVEETYGEDPHLVGEMAYSYVVGMQDHGVSATIKHFAAFSAPEQGLNTGPVHGGERELRTTWLPAFKRAIIDAGAYSIMGSYNSYDGMPTITDEHLMTDILRDEWGYKYWLTSDAGATDRICCQFRMCSCVPVASGKPKVDSDAITLFALPAGNDVEMGGGSYSFERIPQLVEAGKLSIDVVDTAVARQLRAKFALGLFENAYPGLGNETVRPNGTYPGIHTEKAVALARKLDTESIVLLKNSNKTLPLKRDAHVAVIGPMTDFVNVCPIPPLPPPPTKHTYQTKPPTNTHPARRLRRLPRAIRPLQHQPAPRTAIRVHGPHHARPRVCPLVQRRVRDPRCGARSRGGGCRGCGGRHVVEGSGGVVDGGECDDGGAYRCECSFYLIVFFLEESVNRWTVCSRGRRYISPARRSANTDRLTPSISWAPSDPSSKPSSPQANP